MSEEKETINISREKYDVLVKDQNFLYALKNTGVENWEFYNDALRLHEMNKDIVLIDVICP